MQKSPEKQDPSIKGVRSVLRSIRYGTRYMNYHLENKPHAEDEIRYHKIANALGSCMLIGLGVFGIQHTAPHVINLTVDGYQDPNMDASEVFNFLGNSMVLEIEGMVVTAGLVLGGNAQAANRRQEEGVAFENHWNQATN